MRLTLIGYGTRGDVQPFVALGHALAARGHEITVAAPTNMREFVCASGLSYAPLPVDVHALFARDAAQRMLANGKIQAFFKWLAHEERAYKDAMRRVLVEASAGAEGLVVHPLVEDRAAAIGAAMKVPVVPLYFFPVPASTRFASPFITVRNLGFLNPLTHRLLLDMLWKLSRDDVSSLRAELGLPPTARSYAREIAARELLALLSYSEKLFPRPDDWGEHYAQVGSFAMSTELKRRVGERGLSEDTVRWLDQGSPPIYFGFGSMPVLDPATMIALTRSVAQQLGVRAVIGAGWTKLADAPDDVLVVGNVDHEALFARCAGAVHHGGSGTTYATLRAGLPTVVASVFADQPLWGARCQALGVGATLPFARLDASRLMHALRVARESKTLENAQRLGAELEKEDGLATAVRVIEHRWSGLDAPA